MGNALKLEAAGGQAKADVYS